MKILNAVEMKDVLLAISEPNRHVLSDMGIEWDTYVQCMEEVSQVGITAEQSDWVTGQLSKWSAEIVGVSLILVDGTAVADIYTKYDIPTMGGVAAAVLPNHMGMELMLIDLGAIWSHPDRDEILTVIVPHELEHLFQVRRGDLTWSAYGSVQWSGWNPVTLSVAESNYNFATPWVLDKVSAEIIQKPWETEAYALHTPINRLSNMISDDAMEHILANWHKFRPAA